MSSQQRSLGRPPASPRAACRLAAWTFPCSSSSRPGASRQQHRPGTPREMLSVWQPACWWSCLLGLDVTGLGRAAVLLGRLGRTAARWEGCLSFPTLLRNHSMALQMHHLPESHILLQEYGTTLFSSFLPTLTTWRPNCRLPAILPSQVKATQKIQSIPAARMLARLLASWTTGRDTPLL